MDKDKEFEQKQEQETGKTPENDLESMASADQIDSGEENGTDNELCVDSGMVQSETEEAKEAEEAEEAEEIEDMAEEKGSKKKKKKKEKKLEDLQYQLSELNEKYIRLAAEYDNYRRRTLKEKMELAKTGGEKVLLNLLPVIDDFERALKSVETAENIDAVKKGIELIFGKFIDFLTNQGVKEIDALHQEFDTDVHEAVTKTPAPSEELKGKIVDVIEKGYYLNDKVIRFAKVIIGE